MVYVAMGGNEVYGGEAVVTNVVDHGLALFGVERATVYYHGLAGRVANNVAILLKRVYHKTLYVKHKPSV